MNLLRGPQPLLHQPSPQPVAQVNLLGTPTQPALSLNSLSTQDDAFTCQTGRTPFLQPCSTGILAKATRTAQAHSTLPLLPSVILPYQLEFAAHRNSFSLLSQYNHVTEDPLGQWHAQSSTQRTCTGVQESSDAPSGNAHLPARRHLSKDLSHASGRMRHVTSFGEWTPSDWKLARVGSWQTEEHDCSGLASAAGRLDKVNCVSAHSIKLIKE